MGKNKLKKWAVNKTFSHVIEPELKPIIMEGKFHLQGQWHEQVFGNNNPITVELGCGKGEYTIGLARKYPGRNFIGVDVKGHRFYDGAKQAHEEGLKNVAFLRTRVEFIDAFFGKDEVDEIWLTFSDPQPKDEKGNRRITSLWYIMNKYMRFLKPGGLIHIKHDNLLVYDLAMEELEATSFIIETHSPDIYDNYYQALSDDEKEILGWKTYYEKMWLAEGKKITYIRMRVR
ncbi:MAG: tRNA (guanosine(46)-N7)-methyltransferase TrmB [Flavobacteriales bacterium]